MAFKIQKQYIPKDQYSTDPSWAQRKVWVYKLSEFDTVYSFDTLEEANAKKLELENNDSTNREYQVIEV
tara:strand:- start:136 stop:342 length:207 start_codon:yes stop_codon:yes gene_type:complete